MRRKEQGASIGNPFPSISRKQDLQVIELRGRDIVQVEGVLTGKESLAYVRAAESLGFQRQGSGGAASGEAFRDNGRASITSRELADSLWTQTGLHAIMRAYDVDGKKAVGLNPNIRFYRYIAGNRFGKHVDDSVRVGRNVTKYTLLIYLSGGKGDGTTEALVGGETTFYGGKRSRLLVSVTPAPGLALLHLHGDDCLEHEGAAVVRGVKYVLRSDVVYA